MKKIYTLFITMVLLGACSDFDEQNFTVLLPDAGEDQVVFTEDIGNSIQLDGSNSSDVNDIGFEYQWEIVSVPEGFPATLGNANTAMPTLEVPSDAAGRYEISMIINRGDQMARDFVNVDVNPAITQVLLVNAVDGASEATLTVSSAGLSGNAVAPLSADSSYLNIDLNIVGGAENNVTLEVNYNGTILSTTQQLAPLGSYTIYLVGTEANPEILFVQKQRNQNTIPGGLAALDHINIATGVDNVTLFVDARAVGFGDENGIPVDALFSAVGLEPVGTLNFGNNTEIFLDANQIFALPTWATINGLRISNSAFLTLNAGEERTFGTFVLFADADSEFGNTLSFINNSTLLPQ
ncbi:MAG: hypothetical protein AAF969_06820 [Bacteroidota bacterium]